MTGAARDSRLHEGLQERQSERESEYLVSRALMGTVVTMRVVGNASSARARRERDRHIESAFGWFASIESSCSRFDQESELRMLSAHIGTPVEASPMLFEAVQFALAVAHDSNGAFDPTLGVRMESLGFDREYRSGARARSGVRAETGVSYRDVEIDARARTITLHRPLLLDLGAVAKGLAIDVAARELAPLANFMVDAGGDLYLGGHNASDEAWKVGIRHPREPAESIETVAVSDCAVCTSGDYERVATRDGEAAQHHILNPASGTSVTGVASVTVIAASAMVADALGTAAFALGPSSGIALLERHDVEGLMLTPSLERFTTRTWRHAC